MNDGTVTLTSPSFAAASLTGNLSFGDNNKAIFGAGSDLQIFHTGAYSAIRDVGTGALFIGGENYVDIGNAGASETYARFHKDAQVDLYHNNTIKLTTTASGIDVTGTVTADSGAFNGLIKTTDGLFQADKLNQRFRQYAVASGSGNQTFLLGKIQVDGSINGGVTGVVKAAYDPGDSITNVNIHFAFSQRDGTAKGQWWYEHTDDDAGTDVVSVKLIDDGSNNYYVWLDVGDFVQCFIETAWRQVDTNEITDSGNLTASTITSGTTLFDTANNPTSEHHIGKLYAHDDIDVTGTVTADGLTVDGTVNAYRAGFTQGVQLLGDSGGNQIIGTATNDKKLIIKNQAATQGIEIIVGNKAMDIAKNGDISFYEDTGTTAKLTWDASEEDLKFADNSQAIFGDSNDLQIYHDGTNSVIRDNGAGNLSLTTNGSKIGFYDQANNQFLAEAFTGAGFRLYYDGSQKFVTQPNGIDVTGTVTADGLTVEDIGGSVAQLKRTSAQYFDFNMDASSNNIDAHVGSNGKDVNLFIKGNYDGDLNLGTRDTTRLKIADNGDISFYEDTGTTAKLFWDASEEALGLGTSSPSSSLHVVDSGTNPSVRVFNSGNTADITSYTAQAGLQFISYQSDSGSPYTKTSAIIANGDGTVPSELQFWTKTNGQSSPAERLRIDSSGRVGIGTSSPDSGTPLHVAESSASLGANTTASAFLVERAGNVGMTLGTANTGTCSIFMGDTDSLTKGRVQYDNSDDSLGFWANSTERMRIDSSGNVGIGTDSPTHALTVKNATQTPTIRIHSNTTSFPSPRLEFVRGTNDTFGGDNYSDHRIVADSGHLIFQEASSGTTNEIMRLLNNGHVSIGSTADEGILYVASSENTNIEEHRSSNSSYTSQMLRQRCNRGGSSSYYFLLASSGNTADNEAFIRGDGRIAGDAGFQTGADYAEFFEWDDGNSSDEDRRGYSVVLMSGNKIRKATSSDAAADIIGVISGHPSVVGDAAWSSWGGKFNRDDFGGYIWETYTVTEWTEAVEDGDDIEHSYQTDQIPSDVTVPADATVITQDDDGNTLKRKQVNSSYDDTQTYTPREDRQEWDAVGMVGKLRLRVGQPTGNRWIKMRDIATDDDGNVTVEEWLVR
jgi:hemin uptake protein HemP